MKFFDQSEFSIPDSAKKFGDQPLIVHRHKDRGNRNLVVFVHGLAGRRYGTWGSFPEFVFEEFPHVDVGLYEYRTAFRRLLFWKSIELEDEAEIFASDLRDDSTYDSILLIGHSMGGLLCKAAAKHLIDSNQLPTLERVNGLILMAVPQAGSQLVLPLMQWLSSDFRALKPHGKLVTRLNQTFLDHVSIGETPDSEKLHIPTWAVKGASDLAVDRLSAGLNLPSSRIKPVHGSHTSFVKPQTKDEPGYEYVRDRLVELFPPPEPPVTSESGGAEAEIRDREISPSRILRHAPEKLFGREPWLDVLDAAWEKRASTHVCTLRAWGGVGKTSLVAHWVQQRFAAKDWPGVERYFDWSFYSQGTGESRQTSSDLFISRALTFFGDADPTVGGPWERGERLARLVRKRRSLLVLDGIEPLQYPEGDPSGQGGNLKDEGLAALLQGLAADNPGLCVVTTRESLANLHVYNDSTSPEHRLDELPCEAAVDLLRHLLAESPFPNSDEDLAATWKDAGGHALTLQLLGRYLADAHGGDIRKRDLVDLQEADRETQGRSAFKVMAAYERWLSGEPNALASGIDTPRDPASGPASGTVSRPAPGAVGSRAPDQRQRQLAILRLTGLFDRPITPDCLAALRADPPIPGLTDAITPLTDAQWNTAVKHLARINLISLTAPDNTDSSFRLLPSSFQLDAHPLIREYFAERLRTQHGEAFRAAHGRLFAHLCESTPHRPEGLAGLQPLYQAVVHGCLAGRQQEACDKVYIDRILRGTGSGGCYSTFKLGAIGSDLSAVAAFFDQPWSRLSPNLSEADQAWLLNEAAFRLRALGRLTEALEPMRVATDNVAAAENWKNAAIGSSSLSELEVTLGGLESAVADARRGIDFADRSGDAFEQMAERTTAADALHQSGCADEARGLFADAERRQQERQPQFDQLYSVRGFRYCDLLLAPAERAAWRVWLPSSEPQGASRGCASQELPGEKPAASALPLTVPLPLTAAERTAALQACTEVERRGGKLLEWRQPNDSVLDVALEDLTLSRATLYAWLLRADSASLVDPSAFSLPPTLADAVNGLRKAGQFDETPKGLLTSSVCHVLAGEWELAVTELDEALQIARRGPMPLYHADILLTRARLFGRQKDERRKRVPVGHHPASRPRRSPPPDRAARISAKNPRTRRRRRSVWHHPRQAQRLKRL